MTDPWREPDPHLQEALAAIEAERAVTSAEIEAWEAFEGRLRELSGPAATTSRPADRGGLTISSGCGSTRETGRLTEDVRTAFDETVLSTEVSDEYESHPVAQMAEDLGGDLAAAVYGSGPPPGNLLEAIEEAVEGTKGKRRRLLEKVDREEQDLREYRRSLRGIWEELGPYEAVYPDVSARGLFVYYDRLEDLRADCREIAVQRQDQLHSPAVADYDYVTFVEYLYGDCSSTFPVLAAVAETLRDIDELQENILRDIVGIEREVGGCST